MLNQDATTDFQGLSSVTTSNNQNDQGSPTISDAESFTVCVRVRPLHSRELSKKHPRRPNNVISIQDNMVVVLDPDGNTDPNTKREKMYLFDGVFSEEYDTQSVFSQTMLPLLGNVLNGYNATLFAYGMTGAGKTHTLFGELDPETLRVRRPGLIFLTLQELFRKIQSSSYDDYEFSVRISYLEIYNEQVRDLLRGDDQNLMILEDPNKGVFVSDLTETSVSTESEIMQLIMTGNSRRIMASTSANVFSSRSHAIVQVLIERKEKNTGIKGSILQSKLSLIDLAGSERAAATENRGLRMLEGANINRSLLALGNCINVLSDSSKKGAFVPYRDSKLTRLLKDSLGGNTKTIMIACISPSQTCYEETVNTLKYASRAKNIKRKVQQNVKEVELHVSQYKEIIENLKNEVESLKKQLKLKGSLEEGQNGKNEEKLDEKKIEDASHKILDNLEQNWEIAQTLRELGDLEVQNKETLDNLYKHLDKADEEDQIYIGQILNQIETLKGTMENNDKTKKEILGTLQGNMMENKGLKEQLIEFAKNVDTLEDIELAKKLLDIDKLNLVSQNMEIKKEALNLAKTKIQQNKQISQMEEEMRRMKALLQEKDRMLASNNELIQDLRNRIPENDHANSKEELVETKEDQIEQKGQALKNILVNLEKKLTTSINQIEDKLIPEEINKREERETIGSLETVDTRNEVQTYTKVPSKLRTFDEYMKEMRQRTSGTSETPKTVIDDGIDTKRTAGNLLTDRTLINEFNKVKENRVPFEKRIMDDDVLLESFSSIQQFHAPTPSDLLQRINKFDKFEKPNYGRTRILGNHDDISSITSSTAKGSNLRLAIKGFSSGAYDSNTISNAGNSINISDIEHNENNNNQENSFKADALNSGQLSTERILNSSNSINGFYYPQINTRDKAKNLNMSVGTDKTLCPTKVKSDVVDGSAKVGYANMHRRQDRAENNDWQLRRQSFQQLLKENNIREHSLGNIRGSVRSTRDQSRDLNKHSNSIVCNQKERLFESVMDGENRFHNDSVNVEKSGLEIRSLGQERENLKIFRSKLNNLAGVNITKLNKDLLAQIREVIEEYNAKKYILSVKDQEVLRMLGEAIIKYGTKNLEEKNTKPKSKQNESMQEEKKARSASVRRSNANSQSLMASKENKDQSYYQQSKEKRERKASVNSKTGDNESQPIRRSSVGRSLGGQGVLSNINNNYAQALNKSNASGYKAKAENSAKAKGNQQNPPVILLKKVLKERQGNTVEQKKYAASFVDVTENQ